MSEEHPLSLVEQVTPIIDLMARTSSHFARLRDFVTLKFPPGFPVKIGMCGKDTFSVPVLLLSLGIPCLSNVSTFFYRDTPVSCAKCQNYL